METTSPGICGGPPLFVCNLGKETEHNSIHGKILRATIETEIEILHITKLI
jgi:hypothetical protein